MVFVKIVIGSHGSIFFAEGDHNDRELAAAMIAGYAKQFGFNKLQQFWGEEMARLKTEGCSRNR
jgi:hypothetical protein